MIKLLKKFFSKNTKKTLILTFFLCLENVLESVGIGLVIPVFYKLIDNSSSDGKMVNFIDNIYLSIGITPSIFNILLMVVFAFILKGVVMYISKMLVAKSSGTFLTDIQKNLYSQLLRSKIGIFTSKKQGSLINALTLEATRSALSFIYTAQWLSAIFSLGLYLSWAIFLSGPLTLIASFLGFLSIFPLRRITLLCEKFGQKTTNLNEDIQNELIETFGAIKIVKAGAHDQLVTERFFQKIQSYGVNWYKTYFYSSAPTIYSQPIAVIILSIILLLGQKFQLPLPELLVFLMAFQKVVPTLTTIQNAKNNLLVAMPGLEKVDSILKETMQYQEREGGKSFSLLTDGIRVSNLRFAHTSDRPLFDNISLYIPSGKTVALLGKSGQGKTTLVDLILGFYEQGEKSIFINDIDISELDLKLWREKVAYVSQDTVLFHDSIRNNITWGNSSISDEEIFQAAKKAAAYDFINNLEKGLETIIGDRGSKLSGGQKQRIALTRALLRKPQLLILDEATSSLDHESEKKIKESIDQLRKDKNLTIIIIAHRMATVQNADYIYVINDGYILEQGNWQQLIQYKESYLNRNMSFELT